MSEKNVAAGQDTEHPLPKSLTLAYGVGILFGAGIAQEANVTLAAGVGLIFVGLGLIVVLSP